MNRIQLRVPLHLREALLGGIDAADGIERVAFGLVSRARWGREGELLLLRRLIPAPREAYLDPGGHGARWSGRFTIEVMNQALRAELGIVVLHEHGGRAPVALSPDDRGTAFELLERFGRVQEQQAHAMVVLGGSSADGLFCIDGKLGGADHRFDVRFFTDRIEDRTNRAPLSRGVPEEAFARQMLLVGGPGQEFLRRSRVAVVGLSGGGSHVVQQLAHAGVGRIYGIDGDVAEETNRSRMIGLTRRNVSERRRKPEVLKELVSRIGLGTEFVPVSQMIPGPEAVGAVREADAIVGCVDNYHARADLQELAWRYAIPYIDIGLAIDPRLRGQDGTGDGWIAGNVYVLMPGSACLWCTGFLTRGKLDAETDGRPRSYVRDQGGAAQVVSFNGVLASQAASEVIQLLTGFARREAGSRLLKFNGVRGTLEQWAIRSSGECAACRESLAAGDAVWTRVGAGEKSRPPSLPRRLTAALASVRTNWGRRRSGPTTR